MILYGSFGGDSLSTIEVRAAKVLESMAEGEELGSTRLPVGRSSAE